MAKLPKLTLSFDDRKKNWVLKKDKTGQTVKRFAKKAMVTKRNALRKLLGKEGGSVKIQKLDGKFQEERTYPKSRDPIRSPG